MSRYQVSGYCPEPWPAQVLGRMLGSSRVDYYQWRGRTQPTPAPWQAAAQAAFVRATPGATGPAACGRDCTPGAMRWDATPCARGCTSTGCGR